MQNRFLWIVCLLLVTGCGPAKHHVTGTVKLEDGTSLVEGRIIFHPVDKNAKVSCTGMIVEGKYTMGTTSNTDGVPLGKYKVTIDPPATNPDRPKPIPFDPKYQRPGDTPLEIEVTGTREFPIVLKKSLK